MSTGHIKFFVWPSLLTLTFIVPAFAEVESEEPAYSRAIAERSRRIVEPLEIVDKSKSDRIQHLLEEQYRNLRMIHDKRDAKIESLSQDASLDKSQTNNAIDQVRQQVQLEQFQLHRQFVSKLTAELTAEQVEGVKDGMTYGVVPNTYGRYLQVLPNLKEEEKRTIKALLIEAREYAMDGGSSEEKHGWFRKYKGKVNNYLSAAGYDL